MFLADKGDTLSFLILFVDGLGGCLSTTDEVEGKVESNPYW